MLYACQKSPLELVEVNQEFRETYSDSNGTLTSESGVIELGEKVACPLNVENMMAAWNRLFDDKITELLPSHMYVRFLPTFEEYEELEEREDLELFDYPFDYEITRMGDRYHDPSIASNEITWQYAIVPYDFTTTVVNYEILEQLAIVEYNSHWVEEAYRAAGLTYDGTPYGYYDPTDPIFGPPRAPTMPPPPPCERDCWPIIVDGWEWECECFWDDEPVFDPPPADVACGCDYNVPRSHPTGCLTVWDTQHDGGRLEGVEGVRIYAWRRNIVWGHAWGQQTFTEEKGCWHIDKEFARDFGNGPLTIGLRVKFKNDDIVIRGMNSQNDLIGYVESVAEVLTFEGTTFNNLNIEYHPVNGGEAQKRFFAATAMNAFNEYNGFAEEDGISTLSNFDLLLTNGFGGASTPMLDHLNGPVITEVLFATGVSSSVGLILSAFSPGLGLAVTSFLFAPTITVWAFAPDMTFNMAWWDSPSDQIKETFFHEFAHASHFQNVPNSYWVDNIAYVVENEINDNDSPYGNLDTPGSGRTGVIEMWGEYYGPTLTHRLYGLEHSNELDGAAPESETHEANLEERINIWNGVIPAGLIHDLIDNVGDNQLVDGEFVLFDNVSGFSSSQIFNELNGDILSPNELQIRLSSQLPSGILTIDIQEIFEIYGW